jgi:arylsulfatase A
MKQWIIAGVLALLLAGNTAADRAPNIIFFLADDLGYGDLASYNSDTDINTPVLGELAKNGVRFTDHYATAAVCAPSRRAFLSGRWQSRLGEWAEPYPGTPNADGMPADKEPTVAMFLKKAGYATGCFGKWNIGGVDGVSRPGAHGFDEYLCVDHNTDYFFHRKARRTRLSDGKVIKLHDGEIGLYTKGGKTVDLGGKYLPDVFGDAAIDFIEKNKEQPFFIYLPWCVPHNPMQGPNDIKDTKENPIPMRIEEQHNRETFVKMVEYMDAKTGQILDTLKKLGLYDNTLIMFSSDNGGQLLGNCEPLRGHKHTLFEGGIRVPMIAHWPDGFRGGKVVKQPSIMMDVTATIIDAAGAESTRELDGTSLLPWINRTRQPEDRLFAWRRRDFSYPKSRNYLRGEACRYGNLKYVKETKARGADPTKFPYTEYLFDLSKDLGEQENLSKSNPEQLELMRRKYAEWRKNVVNVKDPIFVNRSPDQYGNPTPEQIETINGRYFEERK